MVSSGSRWVTGWVARSERWLRTTGVWSQAPAPPDRAPASKPLSRSGTARLGRAWEAGSMALLPLYANMGATSLPEAGLFMLAVVPPPMWRALDRCAGEAILIAMAWSG